MKKICIFALVFVGAVAAFSQPLTDDAKALMRKIQGVWEENRDQKIFRTKQFSWGTGKYGTGSVIIDTEKGVPYIYAPGGEFVITGLERIDEKQIRIYVKFYRETENIRGHIDIHLIDANTIWFDSFVDYTAWFLTEGKQHLHYRISGPK